LEERAVGQRGKEFPPLTQGFGLLRASQHGSSMGWVQ
jgi:hypothetical protein